MKFLLSTVLIAIGSLLLQFVLPWWSLAVAAFIVGIALAPAGLSSFFSGMLGTAIIWWGYAWMIDINNDSILSEKIAMIFHVGSPAALIFTGGILAGLVGGLAALSGSSLRKAFL